MAEGCPGCFQSQRGIDERIQTLRVRAREMAVQSGKSVAIVQDGADFHLTDALIAFQHHYQIKEIVSHV